MSKITQIRRDGAFITCTDLSDPSTIKDQVLINEQKDSFNGTPDGVWYKDYCWPIASKQDLIDYVTEHQRLKKIYDEHTKVLYELNNKYNRIE